MKYNLSTDEQKNYSLFKNENFIKRILENVPVETKEFFDKIKEEL